MGGIVALEQKRENMIAKAVPHKGILAKEVARHSGVTRGVQGCSPHQVTLREGGDMPPIPHHPVLNQQEGIVPACLEPTVLQHVVQGRRESKCGREGDFPLTGVP